MLGDEICKGTEIESAIPIVSSAITHLCRRNVSFIITSHLHKLCELDVIKNISNLSIKHLSVNMNGGEIIYGRKLSDGNGYTSYGIEVCNTLNMPKEFIEECYKIRNILRDLECILPTKTSRYNSSLYITKCSICGSTKNLHTHHKEPQKNADVNGIITIDGKAPFHKNNRHNLKILCENCHIEYHKPLISIKK